MAFWLAAADADGARIVGTEERLAPGPSSVDYPRDPSGSILETGAGRVIRQVPYTDPRKRAWVWQLLPKGGRYARYDQLFRRLTPLVSRVRREQGLSPWIWLRDTETGGLGNWSYVSGTATSTTATTLVDSSKNLTENAYQNGVIEVVSGTGAGQRRSIVSNTATEFTVTPEWSTIPTGATYSVAMKIDDWIRVRVLSVQETVGGYGTLRHEQVRMEWVIDDPAFNAFD